MYVSPAKSHRDSTRLERKKITAVVSQAGCRILVTTTAIEFDNYAVLRYLPVSIHD